MVCQCLPSHGEQTRYDTGTALTASWMYHSIRVVMKIPSRSHGSLLDLREESNYTAEQHERVTPPPVLLTPIITQGERSLLTTLCAVYLTDEDAHHTGSVHRACQDFINHQFSQQARVSSKQLRR